MPSSVLLALAALPALLVAQPAGGDIAPRAWAKGGSTKASSAGGTKGTSAGGTQGTSTFYGGNLEGGTCSFSTYTLPSGISGTAFSGGAWNSAANCGACLEVTANSRKVKVMIVDRCNECDLGHLDLFSDAFKTLSPSSSDPLATSWTMVDCGISSPLVLHNKSGTSSHWFSMQVLNANEPVAKLEVSTDGGKSWKSTERQDYNFFQQSSGFGTETVTVRVTSRSGKTITVANVPVTANSQVKASGNF